jgi:23S rRNA (uracil1939-C5)-methyltransferase
MVKRAQNNALFNHLDNTEFYQADLMNDITLAPWAKIPFDKILLDPPRTGALAIVQHLAKLKPKRVVYVSCNLATLARDAHELAQSGNQLTNAGVMDMFPHTHHVEAIAVFEKNK